MERCGTGGQGFAKLNRGCFTLGIQRYIARMCLTVPVQLRLKKPEVTRMQLDQVTGLPEVEGNGNTPGKLGNA